MARLHAYPGGKSSRIPNMVQVTSWVMHKRLIHGNNRKVWHRMVIHLDLFMQGPTIDRDDCFALG